MEVKWSADFAYGVGLIATDGNLANDGRHLSFCSKDKDQVENLMKAWCLKNKIIIKKSGYTGLKAYYSIQFSNVNLYRYLLLIGLSPNKSKSISKLKIPDRYFPDFLRGCFDGDGFTYSYWDPRWRSSFLFG